MLITNEPHSSNNQFFYSTVLLSAPLVSKESSRSSLGAPHNILYYTVRYGTIVLTMGRDSSVGIATRYGLDGPGIESRWRRDFQHPSRQTLYYTAWYNRAVSYSGPSPITVRNKFTVNNFMQVRKLD